MLNKHFKLNILYIYIYDEEEILLTLEPSKESLRQTLTFLLTKNHILKK